MRPRQSQIIPNSEDEQSDLIQFADPDQNFRSNGPASRQNFRSNGASPLGARAGKKRRADLINSYPVLSFYLPVV
jgi:hypothetical protein